MKDDIISELKDRSEQAMDALRAALTRIRTGRANLSILDNIRVDYYGSKSPLNQVATLTVADPRLITIKPFDKSLLSDIEKVLRSASDLGISPQNDGEKIMLPIPPLTEERRKEFVKVAKSKAKTQRSRFVTREGMPTNQVKVFEKDGDLPEDDAKKASAEVQKVTDDFVKQVDQVVGKKEKRDHGGLMAESPANAVSVEAPKPRLSPGPVPRHIAIIMDGQRALGRDARPASLRRPRLWRTLCPEIVTTARECGVRPSRLYAFSVQNWERPDVEVERLMELLLDYLVSERETILKNGIRLQGIGQVERLPPRILRQLRFLEEESAHNDKMVLTLALSYGSREEIVDACRAIANDVAAGRLNPDDITEDVVDRYTFTYGLPALDLLIRTSGELRLSNFLLWQAAYTEIVVTEVLWPDFDEPEFFRCIETFRSRERRYGKTGGQVASGV